MTRPTIAELEKILSSDEPCSIELLPNGELRAVPRMDFVAALKIAEGVFEQYRKDQPKWWCKMDGTPILNDVAVRMAEAFRNASTAPTVGEKRG